MSIFIGGFEGRNEENKGCDFTLFGSLNSIYGPCDPVVNIFINNTVKMSTENNASEDGIRKYYDPLRNKPFYSERISDKSKVHIEVWVSNKDNNSQKIFSGDKMSISDLVKGTEIRGTNSVLFYHAIWRDELSDDA